MWGSSPRMRGALRRILIKIMLKRIIPADAGSTILCSSLVFLAADHPRGCGEHIDLKNKFLTLQGSSPRMRGAPPGDSGGVQHVRIIPADAGSTQLPARRGCCRRDHPRGCGEHIYRSLRYCSHEGSSPRMRGAHPRLLTGWQRQGIIPADAGSTSSRMPRICRWGDHPRGCGEHKRGPEA